jgi:hypothetical protein
MNLSALAVAFTLVSAGGPPPTIICTLEMGGKLAVATIKPAPDGSPFMRLDTGGWSAAEYQHADKVYMFHVKSSEAIFSIGIAESNGGAAWVYQTASGEKSSGPANCVIN